MVAIGFLNMGGNLLAFYDSLCSVQSESDQRPFYFTMPTSNQLTLHSQ